VVGDAYAHWVLPRLVGIANAAEILLTGAVFDGHRAVQLGLGSRVLDAADVLPTAVDGAAARPDGWCWLGDLDAGSP
jgi:enoyl-CoA hydratase/carnithine racemase